MSARTAPTRARAERLSLPVDLREERELRLTLAAQQFQIDFDAPDATRLRECQRLRLDHLRGENPARVSERRISADSLEVARQLLDCVDRRDPLDLDGDPLCVFVLRSEERRVGKECRSRRALDDEEINIKTR